MILAQLQQIMPKAPEVYLAPLNKTMEKFAMVSILRQAAFLANVAHESIELTATKENLNYSAASLLKVFPKYFSNMEIAEQYARQPEKIANKVYGGRMGNGLESSGDGWKYRGRGPFQLTGKDNYIAAGRALKLDLLNYPELVEQVEVGCLVAGWYWQVRSLNQLADVGNFKRIVEKINGGLHGYEDRTIYYERAKLALRENLN